MCKTSLPSPASLEQKKQQKKSQEQPNTVRTHCWNHMLPALFSDTLLKAAHSGTERRWSLQSSKGMQTPQSPSATNRKPKCPVTQGLPSVQKLSHKWLILPVCGLPVLDPTLDSACICLWWEMAKARTSTI